MQDWFDDVKAIRDIALTRWVAIFEDDPSADWVRKEHSQEHLDYLDAHKHKILLAGGLRQDPDGWPCGGLWVLEVDSRDDAVHLCEDDPYYKLGLRKSYQLFSLGKAFPDRSVLL
jgi:uncharacterized protein YciI